MQIIDINNTENQIKHVFSHQNLVFDVRNFNNFIEKSSHAIYVIGYVNRLITDSMHIENKTIAGVFSNIIDISGIGFYVIAKLENEYSRVTLPDIYNTGALSYIDGCSNTELISPVKLGFPSINYLHVPAGINQTSHFHRSERIGFVAHGTGYAKTDNEIYELKKNKMFILPANEQHHFFTKNASLSILVFHPDSDIGPTDETNNMKIRTHI